MFTPLFAFIDYASLVSVIFAGFLAIAGLIAGINGLKDKRKKIAKWGIGLSAAGLVIYALIILSLYARFGMI